MYLYIARVYNVYNNNNICLLFINYNKHYYVCGAYDVIKIIFIHITIL